MSIDKEIKELLILIKEQRAQKGISQQEIANHLGITQGAYAKLENGTTDLKLKTLYQIADYLGIDLINKRNNNKEESLIAINPLDIVSDIGNLKKGQADMQRNQEETNQKLDEILALFKKKKK